MRDPMLQQVHDSQVLLIDSLMALTKRTETGDQAAFQSIRAILHTHACTLGLLVACVSGEGGAHYMDLMIPLIQSALNAGAETIQATEEAKLDPLKQASDKDIRWTECLANQAILEAMHRKIK